MFPLIHFHSLLLPSRPTVEFLFLGHIEESQGDIRRLNIKLDILNNLQVRVDNWIGSTGKMFYFLKKFNHIYNLEDENGEEWIFIKNGAVLICLMREFKKYYPQIGSFSMLMAANTGARSYSPYKGVFLNSTNLLKIIASKMNKTVLNSLSENIMQYGIIQEKRLLPRQTITGCHLSCGLLGHLL